MTMRRFGLVTSIMTLTVLVILLFRLAGLASLQRKLIEALPPSRSTEGRLVGFPYKPIVRGHHLNPKDGTLLRRVGKLIDIELRNQQTPDVLRLAAIIKLLDGKSEKAVDLLSEAQRLEPSNPVLLNDLAVALLARSKEYQDPYDLVLALAAVEKSLALRKSDESLFNRSLLLGELYLTKQSGLSWKRYLEMDPLSKWSVEARGHLVTAKKNDANRGHEVIAAVASGLNYPAIPGLVRKFPQAARIYVEDELLPAWARAAVRKEHRRVNQLERVLGIFGRELFNVQRDSLISDAHSVVTNATETCRADLVDGHLLYAEAKDKYEAREYTVAREGFQLAKVKLEACGSPFQYWAYFHLLACDYYVKSYQRALEIAEDLRQGLGNQPYFNLLGRTDWAVGLLLLEQGDAGRAFEAFQSSLSYFAKTGEDGNRSSLCSLLANTLSYLGANKEAWRYRLQALMLASRASDYRRLPVILGEVARAAATEGQPEVALHIQSESLNIEMDSGDPLKISEAFWRRSMIWQRYRDTLRAEKDLSLAFQYFNRIKPKESHGYLLAGMLLTKGMIQRQLEPRAALDSLDRSAGLYRNLGYTYASIDVLVERAKVLLALGEEQSAEAELLAAIQEYERQGDRLMESGGFQFSYFAQAQAIFDELIGLVALSKGRALEAFELAERARARGLLRSLAKGISTSEVRASTWHPLSLREIRSSLPPRTKIICYSVLEDRSLAWLLSKDDFTMIVIPVERYKLQHLVQSFVEAIRSEHRASKGWRRHSGEIFDILLRSFSSRIALGDDVVIVPDKELRHLPFAALLDKKTGRFLVEDYFLFGSPSVSFYLSAPRFSTGLSRAKELTVFAVGGPRFRLEKYPWLPLLPGAEAEAFQAASSFPGSVALVGPGATAARFYEEINRHEIFHYAGHALIDQRNPAMSRMLLSPSMLDDSSGDLLAGDVARLHLDKPKLVVLSACDTATGRLMELDGAGELAHAFLLAGVPTVVVSLWGVNDAGTNAFWREFYRDLAGHGEPSRALRAAQISSIRNNQAGNSAAWAVYQALGVAPIGERSES